MMEAKTVKEIICFVDISIVLIFYSYLEFILAFFVMCNSIYRVIHKSLQDFQPVWYSSQDGHTEGEHVSKGRNTASFCPSLHMLDSSFLLCLSWLLHSQGQEFWRNL
jgi:hypothetical protein